MGFKRAEVVARLRQHHKDVELILACARKAGQELPLSAAHRELLAAAVAAGDGDLDNAAVIRQLRRPGSGSVSYTHLTLPTILLV